MAKEKEEKKMFDGSAHEAKGNLKFFQGKDAVGSEAEKQTKPAWIISRQDHPITLSYGGEAIIIPPRGRELIANYEMLGALPKGVSVVPKL